GFEKISSSLIRVLLSARRGHIFQRRQQPFGRDWDFSYECAGRIEDRRRNCGSRSVHRQFAHAFRAKWPVRVFLFNYDRLNLRRVERGRYDVIGQAVIHDAPTLPDQFFEQSIADGLQGSAFDLSRRHYWMNRAADVLRGRDLERRHLVCVDINFDFDDIGPVRVNRIGVACVSVIVPFDARRTGVTRKGAQFAAQVDVLTGGLVEARKPLSACCEPAFNQFHVGLAETFGDKLKQLLFRFTRRELNDSTDDHAGSRSYSRTAIGHARRVGLFDLDIVITYAQFISHDLTKDRASSLPDFRRA